MIRAVARRALVPLLLLAGGVAAVTGVAVLAGESAERAVAVGLYAVGALIAILGFALGSRNFFRSTRHARSEEEGLSRLSETNEAAALLIVIGLVLLLVGTAVDPHARLL